MEAILEQRYTGMVWVTPIMKEILNDIKPNEKLRIYVVPGSKWGYSNISPPKQRFHDNDLSLQFSIITKYQWLLDHDIAIHNMESLVPKLTYDICDSPDDQCRIQITLPNNCLIANKEKLIKIINGII
jgi:hypothetical protein